jgi:formamidopyrimidine-DNA glycosylase
MGWGHEGRTLTEEEHQASTESPYPPKYAYLLLETDTYRIAFCDPRKFGKCELRTDCGPLQALAPDAWLGPADVIGASILQQTLGIKALLLDQKRACSGVGNWVADEIFYQCRMHPDQTFLSAMEARKLVDSMQTILAIAVQCLADHEPYPLDWLFAYRWTKKKAGRDSQGRSITFLQSGGRTSAIIASIQTLYKRKRTKEEGGSNKTKTTKKRKTKQDIATGDVDKKVQDIADKQPDEVSSVKQEGNLSSKRTRLSRRPGY